jgi:phosphate transport system substrate-binding protein
VKARRFFLALLSASAGLACASCGPADEVSLQGAGATFPAPLYKRWFLEYYKKHPEVRVNYQAIGSGAGIRQFTEGLVSFGASDAAMSDKEIARVQVGVVLLPMTAGSVVLSYNVPGASEGLKLSREALANIALGKITNWRDPAIAKANPGVDLPDLDITWVRRSDGSGTTYCFTNHLSAASAEWKKGPGRGKTVVWPVGVGAKGNNGVAALIQQTPGAIGYVEYGYADLVHLPMATLENKAGKFIVPGPESSKKSLAEAKLPKEVAGKEPDLRLWMPDPEGSEAYPIVTYTWLLCYKHYDDAEEAAAFKRVIRYCLTDGQKIAPELGYVALPDEVAAAALKALERITP